MWTKSLDHFLRHIFRKGALHVVYPDGERRTYGNADTGPTIAITLHDADLPKQILLSPELAVGEAYMDARLTIDEDDLYGFLHLAITNIRMNGQPWFRKPMERARQLFRKVQQFNPTHRAQANVAHHYDLSGALYDLFLDADRQYSCAYFNDPSMTLEAAQDAKKHHIARKLLIEPGMRVLDIGCGWGGMGLTLARDYGAEVVGVTLSKEQHKLAQARAQKAGLAHRLDFRLMDYRKVDGQFDRIVSVGMFEHVGLPHYRAYFRHIHDLLTPDGVALVHTIGRAGRPGATSPWITRYIFPGGYCPSLSEASQAFEKEGLVATDVEIWRLHYAETLRHWYERFMANIDKAEALYDARFCRMWRYYLIASELTFRLDNQVVFQMQLAPNQANVPLTRDYLYSDATPTPRAQARAG